MFLLLQIEYNYFDYEDIVGKLNFEKIVGNYFICLISGFSVEVIFKEYLEFLAAKKDYDFESMHKTLLYVMDEKKLEQFKQLAEKEAENVKKDDYAHYDIIHFLLDIAKFKNDPIQYKQFRKKYSHILGDDENEEFETVD